MAGGQVSYASGNQVIYSYAENRKVRHLASQAVT